MKHVLVTGASGFVGRHVVAELLERGYAVTAAARDADRARHCKWIGHVQFVVQDIHLPLEDPVERFGRPDIVIHLAWPRLPNYDGLFHFEENLPAACRFLKSLVQGGVKHLLVAGTCLEYGMQSGALAETLPSAPVNAYALAKDALRRFLQQLQRQHAFRLQWARLFYLFGPGQNANCLLPLLDAAIDRREAVFNMSGGEQLRDYLPVEELARRLVALVGHPECDGIVNVCSGEPISVRRLVERHIKNRNASIALNTGAYPYPDYEPMAFWGNNTRLKRWLDNTADGIQPVQTDLGHGITS